MRPPVVHSMDASRGPGGAAVPVRDPGPSPTARTTNFDPGGLLMLLTVVAGAVSVGVATLASRLGYGAYERNVAAVLGVLLAGWVVASLLVSTAMLRILAVTLAMAGAFVTTRDVAASSYGWVLGVVLLFAALSALDIYAWVDRTGTPRGLLSRHFPVFYHVGLFVAGAVGGLAVEAVRRRREREPGAP